MTAYQAGAARVSSTVTKRNPRPRKYASASERQAAYRDRAPEVCFRAEAKTVETLDRIAAKNDRSRAELLLSMTKFALANHDWARFGLTHKPLPYGYGLAEQEFVGPRQANPQPIWKRTRPKSLGKPVPLTPKQKAAAKAMAKAAGRKYPNLVDNIAASRLENPTMKKPTPAQLAARAKFAEMARSGAFKRKAKRNPAKKTVSQKISQLTREGYPQKQAVAIALEEQRAGKVKATPRKRNPSPSIKVGDYVRSYDFPGIHDDYYLEGMVAKIGNGVYVIDVSRRVVGGEEKSIPASLRRVQAPIDPHFITGVYGVQKLTRMNNPRATNPIDPMGGYAPLYGQSIEGMTESKIEYIAERYMDRLDRDLMSGAITSAQYERDVKALNKFVKEAMSKRKRNPATGTKKSRTKLNPKPRMAKIAFLTRGGQREVIEVPISFAFKEYVGNYQEDFFARKEQTKGVPFDTLVVSEKSTGMKVGVVPRDLRAVFGDRVAAKKFVQNLAEQVGAQRFRAQIALNPKIA